MNPGVPYYLANLREIPSMYCIPIILLSGCNKQIIVLTMPKIRVLELP